jgi:hypothetical protein
MLGRGLLSNLNFLSWVYIRIIWYHPILFVCLLYSLSLFCIMHQVKIVNQVQKKKKDVKKKKYFMMFFLFDSLFL